MIAYLILTG